MKSLKIGRLVELARHALYEISYSVSLTKFSIMEIVMNSAKDIHLCLIQYKVMFAMT